MTIKYTGVDSHHFINYAHQFLLIFHINNFIIIIFIGMNINAYE